MYELYRNSYLDSKVMIEKIFPIRVEKLELDNPKVLESYYKYWDEEEKSWGELATKYYANQRDHRMVRSIKEALPDLLEFLSNINTKTTDILSDNNFKEIIAAINKK